MNYLSKELAEEIVERTMSIIRHNINMMDENGVIIASGDRSRIGDEHAGAKDALAAEKGYQHHARRMLGFNGNEARRKPSHRIS
ncbi:sugar diacid recognition domain-containing protein [Bacillus licheniformis]